MKDTLRLSGVMLFCVLFAGCGNILGLFCTVDAAATPSNAMADHTAAPPGNQVQFSVISQTSGACACSLVVTAASWTTSDPVNTAISNQPPTQGLATCLNATPSPATITYTGTFCGHQFTPATLTCK